MKHYLLLAVLAACAVDPSDHQVDPPPPLPGGGGGSGSGSGSGGGGGGTNGASGDPSLNRIVLTSKDTQIVVVDPINGGHRVVTDFGNSIDIQSLVIEGSTIYAGAEDNSMNAVDLASGDLLWETPIGRYENSSLSDPRVEIRDGTIYGAGLNGLLAARATADAAFRWDYAMPPSGDIDSYYSAIGRPLVTADRIYIGTTSSLDTNYLHAIDRLTGARIWRIVLPHGLSGTPKLAGGKLIVPAGDLYALDPATGSVSWRFAQEPLSRGVGTPSIAGASILVQGADHVADGRLYCIDLATGARRWAIPAGNDYAGTYAPTTKNGVVLGVYERGSAASTTGNGAPFLASIATGQILWQNMDVSVGTSPVLANGRVYFHGQNFRGTGGIDNNVGLLSLDATTGGFVALDNYFRYSQALTPLVVATNGVFRVAADSP